MQEGACDPYTCAISMRVLLYRALYGNKTCTCYRWSFLWDFFAVAYHATGGAAACGVTRLLTAWPCVQWFVQVLKLHRTTWAVWKKALSALCCCTCISPRSIRSNAVFSLCPVQLPAPVPLAVLPVNSAAGMPLQDQQNMMRLLDPRMMLPGDANAAAAYAAAGQPLTMPAVSGAATLGDLNVSMGMGKASAPMQMQATGGKGKRPAQEGDAGGEGKAKRARGAADAAAAAAAGQMTSTGFPVSAAFSSQMYASVSQGHQPMLHVVPLQMPSHLDSGLQINSQMHLQQLVPLMIPGGGPLGAGHPMLQALPQLAAGGALIPAQHLLSGRDALVATTTDGLRLLMHSSEELRRKKRQQARRAELNQRRALVLPDGTAAPGAPGGASPGSIAAAQAINSRPGSMLAVIQAMPMDQKREHLVMVLRRSLTHMMNISQPRRLEGLDGSSSYDHSRQLSLDGTQRLEGKDAIISSPFFKSLKSALPALVQPKLALPAPPTMDQQQQQHLMLPLPPGLGHAGQFQIAIPGMGGGPGAPPMISMIPITLTGGANGSFPGTMLPAGLAGLPGMHTMLPGSAAFSNLPGSAGLQAMGLPVVGSGAQHGGMGPGGGAQGGPPMMLGPMMGLGGLHGLQGLQPAMLPNGGQPGGPDGLQGLPSGAPGGGVAASEALAGMPGVPGLGLQGDVGVGEVVAAAAVGAMAGAELGAAYGQPAPAVQGREGEV